MKELYARRNPAIDMLRALTMCLMIFVGNFFTVKDIPHWLVHAKATEDFLGLSDFVFPAFLFAMGMSIPYAIENRFSKGNDAAATLWHILRRGFTLVLMGVFMVNAGDGLNLGPNSRTIFFLLMSIGFFLVWNDYKIGKPWKTLLQLCGVALLSWMFLRYRTVDGHIFQPRYWGILGLIGWAYLACAIIYLIARDNLKVLGGAWLCFVAICSLSTVTRAGHPVLDLLQPNIYDSMRDILRLDNAAHHALAMGGCILSVVGVKYASGWKEGQRILAGVAASAVLIGLGFLAHKWFIASKILATLPWVLWVSALCVLLYTLLQILVRHGITRWYNLIKPAGTATLTMYFVPHLFGWIYVLAGWNLRGYFSLPVGLLYCAGYVFLTLAITWGLGKLHIRLKI